MANFFQHAYIVILLNFCVDLGNGQWKKSVKGALRYDLKLYQKISEKIDRELMTIHEDYPNEDVLDYYFDEINKIQEKINHDLDLHHNKHNNLINSKLKTRHKENFKNETLMTFLSNKINNSLYKWPKFEDILVAMGKKYDWKNDRWIKIKKKMKDDIGNEINAKKSGEAFAGKHKFIYKIVKLNRAKSKRNIVIAVTAVR